MFGSVKLALTYIMKKTFLTGVSCRYNKTSTSSKIVKLFGFTFRLNRLAD